MMKLPLSWKKPIVAEQELLIAMTKLFADNERLLYFVFNSDQPKLRDDPENLIEAAKSMSSGEYVLIRLALDIWNESGGVQVNELLRKLDPINFAKAIATLRYVGPKEKTFMSSRLADGAWDGKLF
jgi:hypothetical protein